LRVSSSSGDQGPLLTLALPQHGALPMAKAKGSEVTEDLNVKNNTEYGEWRSGI